MAQELPASAERDRLGLILSGWRGWNAHISEEPRFERKLGGLSNDNFLVTSGKRQFVVRLNNDSFDLDVNRQVELHILAEIAGQTFAPAVVYASDSCLVTAFIEGNHPENPDPAAMGDLLRRIHGIHMAELPPLDPYLHLERYMSRVTRPPETLQACFKAVMSNRTDSLESRCLCHNDLLLENVLATPSGLVAIDWEYARPGDAAFDLAVVAHTYEFDEPTMARMLTAYGADEAMAARVEHFRDIYALVEICWWLIRGRTIETLETRIHSLEYRLGIS